MKRTVCMIFAVLICVSLVCPVLAADTFVPSISYKDHPEIEWPVMLLNVDGEIIDEVSKECLIITPVAEAKTSTKIPEEARENLLDVYEKLTDGSMKIPYEELDENLDSDKMVIRDLFDVTLLCDDVIKQLEEGAKLQITFDLDVDPNTDVTVLTYQDGEWILVEGKNNGDGTVTVILGYTGVVAFAVPTDSYKPPVQTGDVSGGNLILWGVLLAVSAVALVVLLVSRRKLVQQ